MSVNDFARGRVVYGNGSYAPNRGPVSPQGAMGYLQREISKPRKPQFAGASVVGPDGQSDTRSGVAAGMLRNTKGHPKNPKGNKGPKGPKGPKEPQEPQAPPPPQVKINDNGTLDLPFNDNWSNTVLDAYQSMNSELMGITAESQQQGLEYMGASRDLNQQYGSMQRDTLSDAASRGTAFSSGYGMNVAENARQYGNARNDLDTQNSMFGQNTELQRLAIQNAFNEMLRRDIMRQAAEEAADEGHEAPKNPKDKKDKDKKPGKKGGRK